VTRPGRLVAAGLVRALALFPAGYRREYGEERACVVRLMVADTATRGWLPLLQLVACEMRDLPPALVDEHWKAWRQSMDGNERPGSLPEESMTRWQTLWFALPFLFLLILPIERQSGGGLWLVAPLLLLGLTIALTVAGLVRGLPTWALPGLGLATGFVDLLLLRGLVWGLPGWMGIKASLWTAYMPERVLYALIHNAVGMVPVVLLLLLLALLLPAFPGYPSLRQRLARDWTLLPFLLYTTFLLTPFVYDAYQGLEPTTVVFLLVMAAGAWLYLRAAGPGVRLAILLAATLLAGAVLALGVYLIFPAQSFGGGFPRWWETLMPLVDALVKVGALVLLALLSRAWSRRRHIAPRSPAPAV
jgi:hypothetical protein